MADTVEEEGVTIVPRIHQLLPKVHQELFQGRKGAHSALTRLAEWKWGADQDWAFQELKKRMAEDVILAIPNETDPFMVEADAQRRSSQRCTQSEAEQKMETRRLYVEIPFHDRTKL